MTVLRIPHQTLPKGELHYIPQTAAKPSRLDAPTYDGNCTWTETDVNILTHCWWFWGQTELGWACYLSPPVFTCKTCFMFASVFFLFFLFTFFFFFSLEGVFQVVVWEEWYICIFFREEEKKKLIPHWHFVGLLTGFQVTWGQET